MIRGIVFRLLFCRIPKNNEWHTLLILKSPFFDDYIAPKIVCVRFFYITFASTLIKKLICYG